MKRYLLNCICLMISLLFMEHTVNGQTQSMRSIIQENFQFAAKQYQVLQKNTGASVMPKTFDTKTNQLQTSKTKWWCSGFYPGSLWMIYENTGEESIRKEAENRLAILEKEKYYTGNHDLGFMIYCSFGNAYRITKNEAYRSKLGKMEGLF